MWPNLPLFMSKTCVYLKLKIMLIGNKSLFYCCGTVFFMPKASHYHLSNLYHKKM